jgi:SAM-dependent methyltransferase
MDSSGQPASGQRRVKLQLKNTIGLELGGPSDIFSAGNLFPIYALAHRIDNCNFAAKTEWAEDHIAGPTFVFAENKQPGYQYIREARDLSDFASASYDFVCSSHTLEHCANPIRALRECSRVLKSDGYLFLVLPHKDGTFDHKRPVTNLAHLIADAENDVDEADLTHLPEILALHDLSMDPMAGTLEQFRARSLQNRENRCLHHHVFDTALAARLVDHCGFQILSVTQTVPYHIIVSAQKLGAGFAPDNARFISRQALCYLNSPFASDRARNRESDSL